jgi:hypothetical protein
MDKTIDTLRWSSPSPVERAEHAYILIPSTPIGHRSLYPGSISRNYPGKHPGKSMYTNVNMGYICKIHLKVTGKSI